MTTRAAVKAGQHIGEIFLHGYAKAVAHHRGDHPAIARQSLLYDPRLQRSPWSKCRALLGHEADPASKSVSSALSYSRSPNTNIPCPAATATYCLPSTE
jgi:hypothetical protein